MPRKTSSYTIVLIHAGGQKIDVINAVREITGLALAVCTDLVESVPKSLMEGLTKAQAGRMKAILATCGAEVDLRNIADTYRQRRRG